MLRTSKKSVSTLRTFGEREMLRFKRNVMFARKSKRRLSTRRSSTNQISQANSTEFLN